MDQSPQREHSTSPGRLRSWAGAGILALIGTGFEVGSYQNDGVSTVCFGLAGAWWLYLVMTWPPVRRRMPRFARLRPGDRVVRSSEEPTIAELSADVEAKGKELIEVRTNIGEIIAYSRQNAATLTGERDSLAAQLQVVTEQRDEALDRLRSIEESRPLLSMTPFVRPVIDQRGDITGYEAHLQVENQRPQILVKKPSVKIAEWGWRFGEYLIREDHPGGLQRRPRSFTSAVIRRVPGQDGDFFKTAEFVVATIAKPSPTAYFAIAYPDPHLEPLDKGALVGLLIEVSAENLGTAPVAEWFEIRAGGSPELLTFARWQGPSAPDEVSEADILKFDDPGAPTLPD